jgi:hypothetical protein
MVGVCESADLNRLWYEIVPLACNLLERVTGECRVQKIATDPGFGQMRQHSSILYVGVFTVWLALSFTTVCGADMIRSWKSVYDELSLEGKVLNPPFEYFWTNSATRRRSSDEPLRGTR